jgi:acyl-coenzyme A thioesterase PaaI-like protein
MATAESRFRVGVLDAFGIRIVAPGHAELDVAPYVVNSLGAVQGGALATLAERAVESLDPTGASVPVDLQLGYLSLAKIGPVQAKAEPVGPGVARVDLVDEGNGRRTTVALARTERAEAVR